MAAPLTLDLIGRALAACIAHHPGVSESMFARVVATAAHESALQPFAIHDNRDGFTASPATAAEARALIAPRLARGDRIDAGPMQVMSDNWPRLGLSLDTVLDPDANICAGARILAEDIAIERRASCRYNSGRPDCTTYADAIDRAEARLPLFSFAPPVASAAAAPPAFARADQHAEPMASGHRLFTHFGD